ncbi:putative kinesin light chain [Xylogone sp. PMI_703]|nr:putative kinesin light chain [Xylogone sp. PMI_703]
MSALVRTHEEYTIAWICALPLEAAAAIAMLDQIHPKLSQPTGDDNAYTLGEISGHNIVIACLPSGVYGTTSAATVTAQIAKNDIRLGDIVVSRPTDRSGGVVQYDHGKTVTDGVFHQTGVMNRAPHVLLNAIAQLQANGMLGDDHSTMDIVSGVLATKGGMQGRFSRPEKESDRLFKAEYVHPEGEDTCINCEKEQTIERDQRASNEPHIHYGLIASGNQVMKDGKTRDRLAREHGILCFEMEAAGLVNQLPCLVIRGWQGYAALTAASYTKILLSMIYLNQPRELRTSRTACWMVPFERNPRFLGRQDEITKLEEMILSEVQTRKVAIAGLGGVGKTQIALELAYRVRDKRPECSIFWIVSTSIEVIEQAFLKMSELLGLQDVSPTAAKARVKQHLSSETACPWFLIIDNADDMDMWMTSDSSSPALKQFLPYSKHGFILFTTRNRQLATKLVGPNVINVPEMDDEKATELLKASLIHKHLVNDHGITVALLHQLSCLPLAIIQAASYINEMGTSLQENETVELLSQDFEDDWRYEETKNPVAATWLISFHQIRKSDPLAAEYLSLMSCIDPRDIPRSILPPHNSKIKQENALGLLKAYSFVTGQTDGHLLSIHRLVHLATRNWLRNEGTLDHWTVRTGKRLREVFPSNAHENRILWREYLRHTHFILQSKEFQSDSQDREQLSFKVATCLYSDGRYYEAQGLFEWLVEKSASDLGQDCQETLTRLAWVASTFWNQGRWTEAEKLEVQVIETRKTVLGPDHPNTLTSMANLASTFWNQGRWTEAEKLNMQVIETRKTVLGPDHPNTLTSMWNLSHTWKKQGRDRDALVLLEACVQLQRQKLGLNHPDTVSATANLDEWRGSRDEFELPTSVDLIQNLPLTYQITLQSDRMSTSLSQLPKQRKRDFLEVPCASKHPAVQNFYTAYPLMEL